MSVYIIGCGGSGSWLAASMNLLLQTSSEFLTGVDGDTVEKKNLARQFFTKEDIGKNKAQALSEREHLDDYVGSYFHRDTLQFGSFTTLMVCVDNNKARLEALEACDRDGCKAIFAANEVFSSEAYLYLPQWKGTRLDPRVMYPEILTDHSNDPMARSIGCTGAAQIATPQLVSANLMAASLAQHLYVLWVMQIDEIDPEVRSSLPHKLVANLSKLETHKCGNITNERTENETVKIDS